MADDEVFMLLGYGDTANTSIAVLGDGETINVDDFVGDEPAGPSVDRHAVAHTDLGTLQDLRSFIRPASIEVPPAKRKCRANAKAKAKTKARAHIISIARATGKMRATATSPIVEETQIGAQRFD